MVEKGSSPHFLCFWEPVLCHLGQEARSGRAHVDMFGKDRHQVLRLRQCGFKGDAKPPSQSCLWIGNKEARARWFGQFPHMSVATARA